jgi:hypothetical protein
MQSTATTVDGYLSELPAERRKEVSLVRAAMKKHVPKGYSEIIQYGMISYVVPLKLYPAGYLGKPDVPVPFASLASQKNHLSLYLMNVSGDPKLVSWFRAAWAKSGKKLDMGKSCIRFKKAEDLALDVIGEALQRTPVSEYIARYDSTRGAGTQSKTKTAKRATKTRKKTR